MCKGLTSHAKQKDFNGKKIDNSIFCDEPRDANRNYDESCAEGGSERTFTSSRLENYSESSGMVDFLNTATQELEDLPYHDKKLLLNLNSGKDGSSDKETFNKEDTTHTFPSQGVSTTYESDAAENFTPKQSTIREENYNNQENQSTYKQDSVLTVVTKQQTGYKPTNVGRVLNSTESAASRPSSRRPKNKTPLDNSQHKTNFCDTRNEKELSTLESVTDAAVAKFTDNSQQSMNEAVITNAEYTDTDQFQKQNRTTEWCDVKDTNDKNLAVLPDKQLQRAKTNCVQHKLVPLQYTDEEFKEVESSFRETMNNEIIKVS